MTWREKIAPYQNRVIAVAIALVIGILLLTIGFWKTVLLAIIACIGYLVGSKKDGTLNAIIQRVTGFFSRR